MDLALPVRRRGTLGVPSLSEVAGLLYSRAFPGGSPGRCCRCQVVWLPAAPG